VVPLSLRMREGMGEQGDGSAKLPSGVNKGADTRRAVLSSLLPLLGLGMVSAPKEAQGLQYGSGQFTGQSAVNGVLSAYGLPQLPDKKGFTPFLGQYDNTVIEFQHPSSWVINDRARMTGKKLKKGDTGITVSDYRTAEGLTVFCTDTSKESIADVTVQEIADVVIEQGGSRASAFKKLKVTQVEGGVGQYVFEWESNTVSGYSVVRASVCGARVVKGSLYVLSGVVTKQRLKTMLPTLEQVAQSLQVYTL